MIIFTVWQAQSGCSPVQTVCATDAVCVPELCQQEAALGTNDNFFCLFVFYTFMYIFSALSLLKRFKLVISCRTNLLVSVRTEADEVISTTISCTHCCTPLSASFGPFSFRLAAEFGCFLSASHD